MTTEHKSFADTPIVFTEVYANPIAQKLDVLYDELFDAWCGGITEDKLPAMKRQIMIRLYQVLQDFQLLEKAGTV